MLLDPIRKQFEESVELKKLVAKAYPEEEKDKKKGGGNTKAAAGDR